MIRILLLWFFLAIYLIYMPIYREEDIESKAFLSGILLVLTSNIISRNII